MEYLTVKEAAEKWGYCESTVRRWCKEGIISVTLRAEKKNRRWMIPSDAKCPRKIKNRRSK